MEEVGYPLAVPTYDSIVIQLMQQATVRYLSKAFEESNNMTSIFCCQVLYS